MTVVVTHTTPADASFSTTGAAAWNATHTLSGVGTMAEQDANNVAITGGNINGTTIGGTTPAAGTFTTLTANTGVYAGGAGSNVDLNVYGKGTGSVVLYTGSNLQAKVTDAGVVNTSWTEIQGGISATKVYSNGSGSNIDFRVSSKGTGAINFYTNAQSQEQMRVSHTASAVNYVQVTGAATTASPTISAQGSDSNIRLQLSSKGAEGIQFFANGARQLFITDTASAVNYWSVTGSAASKSPTFTVAGSDTNIAQVFQSKGTGAIDLAAGSSGVNISNGGTVTAITLTSAGNSAYTTAPTVAITAPTTAGGVQATATIPIMVSTAVAVSGGTGYTVNDVLTVSGGTFTSAAQLTVSAVSGGVITAVTTGGTARGQYTVAPSNPASVTGGTGTGATFTLGFSVANNTSFTITNAGSGYVEQPTVSFSGGGGSGAAAYATVGSGTLVKSIGSTMDFYMPSGIGFSIADGGVTGGAYAQAFPNSTLNVLTRATGSGTNLGFYQISKGTGGHAFTTNGTTSTIQLNVAHTASAVNYVQVTGAATGNGPIISAQGSDINMPLNLSGKGGSGIAFYQNGFGTPRMVQMQTQAGAVNYLTLTPSLTTVAPKVSVDGSDTNIDLALTPKGTGALVAQASDGGTTINARGANAVDLQMIRDGAAYVASGTQSVISGGRSNVASGTLSVVGGGQYNLTQSSYSTTSGGFNNSNGGAYAFIGSGNTNNSAGWYSSVVSGLLNSSQGYFNFIGGGSSNSANANAAVTTQSATMNGTTAVTLSGSNANIKVGQLVTGTSIVIGSNTTPFTYVAAISGTSLTLSQNASGSSTSTLSFFTPHGVVVGGGNNQATGSYSFIGGGGDAGTAANRNVASGDWSVVAGGLKNVASGTAASISGGYGGSASGPASFIGGGGLYGEIGTAAFAPNTSSGVASSVVGGWNNTASNNGAAVLGSVESTATGFYSAVLGGSYGTTRGLIGNVVIPAGNSPVGTRGGAQSALLVLGVQTTDATATVLRSNTSAASTTNQVILPNNSAYYFRGEVVSGVTGGGNTKGWYIEGVIKRGANAASTALVGIPTVTSNYADVGASTWTIAVTADTTNGGLAVTFTGQASTTIRTVAQIRTTEMTY